MARDEKATYYDAGELETIDIIKAKLTDCQYTGYLLGCILKYGCRLNWKGTMVRDVEKLGAYQEMLFKHFKEMRDKV